MRRATATLIALGLAIGLTGCDRSTTSPKSGPNPNPNPTMRLSAVELRSVSGGDLAATADRDTTTGVAVEGTLEAVVRFDHPVEIRRVKAHGTGSRSSSRPAARSCSRGPGAPPPSRSR